MTTKIKSKTALKRVGNRYSEEFKRQALSRAAQDSLAVMAKDLGLVDSQLYAWRATAWQSGQSQRGARL